MVRRLIASATTFGLAAALGLSMALSTGAPAQAETENARDPENTIVITVGLGYDSDEASAEPKSTGKVVIQLWTDVAPGHATRIKELAREKFYDGVPFHRVITDFMAQTGDPTGTGRGRSQKPNLKAEFNKRTFARGVVGMARGGDRDPERDKLFHDSANSQFFIMLADGSFLDENYTAFGKVLEGMEIVDRIKRGPRNLGGAVQGARDRMISVRVEVDL